MTRRSTARFLRIEWLLAAAGTALLIWCGYVAIRATVFQRTASSSLDRLVQDSSAAHENSTLDVKRIASESAAASLTPISVKRPEHQLVGRLEIPRLNVSVMVKDGDDDPTLSEGGGHLSDTPMPWELGNSAIAGHRDSFFRPLQHVRVKDRLRMVTEYGTFQYEVSRIVVVMPDDLSVLAPGDGSLLTLVTCYPFSYIGHAPKRFIVQARHLPG